jgi:hypothetical protein
MSTIRGGENSYTLDASIALFSKQGKVLDVDTRFKV